MPEAPDRPPIAQAPLSVVLPAYNAAGDIEVVLRGWVAYLEGLGREYELSVIDDGSSDRTAELVEALAEQTPRLRLLQHPTPQGYGAALRTGLAASYFPLFFYADCSSAYVPADMDRLLKVIDLVDVVCGYRVLPTGQRWRRPWSETALVWTARLVFGVRLRDVNCAFKLFRRSLFPRLPIQSDGPFVHAELVAKANFLGCLLAEEPVQYRPAMTSPTSISLWRKDAYQVFRQPDFGPANVNAAAAP
jgi:glycosyltransferase involved in cell wall biosynthesis